MRLGVLTAVSQHLLSAPAVVDGSVGISALFMLASSLNSQQQPIDLTITKSVQPTKQHLFLLYKQK
jgi:hypothetical protein